MAVSIFCLIVGTSGASNASFLFVILFLFVMKRNSFISFLFLFLVSLISYFLWISFQDQILNIVFPGKKLESIQTGTGRKGMWAIYLDGFLQKPIFGFGFPTGEKEGDRFGWMVTSSSHNMLISAAINSGIIGLSLLLAFLIKYYNYCRKMWLVLGYTEFRWILGGFLIIAINSLSLPAIGSTWMWMTSPIYCLFVYSVFNYKLNIY